MDTGGHPYLAFRQRLLQTEAVHEILAQYQQKGGDRDDLISLLWFLTPEAREQRIPRDMRPPLGQRFTEKLIACEATLFALFSLFPNSSSRRVRSLQQAAKSTYDAIRGFRRSPKAMQSFLEAWGLARRRGRPPGPTPQSLIPAVLAMEFRRRAGRPRHRHILTMMEAANPNEFAQTADAMMALRKRIKSAPQRHVIALHAAFFTREPQRRG